MSLYVAVKIPFRVSENACWTSREGVRCELRLIQVRVAEAMPSSASTGTVCAGWDAAINRTIIVDVLVGDIQCRCFSQLVLKVGLTPKPSPSEKSR